MKTKSTVGKSSVIRACIAIAAAITTSFVAMPFAANAQSVVQVPTSNRYAGTTSSGWNGDGGPTTRAVNTELNNPSWTVFDTAGNLYISDTGNNCVRKVNTSGYITVVAGYEATPASADTCNTGGATIAPAQGLSAPTGLAFNAAGDLIIADSGHNCIRKLSAADLTAGVGSSGLVAIVDTCTNYGTAAATDLSVVPNPQALILDPAGDEVVSIYDPNDPNGSISQVIYHKEAAPADPPTLVCDLAGTPVLPGHGNVCPFFNGQGYPLNGPVGLAIDQAGDYFLADSQDSCVRELAAGGFVSTPVGQCASDGSGIPVSGLPSFTPVGIAVGNQGYLYIASSDATDSTVLQFTGGLSTPNIVAGYLGSTPGYSIAQEGIAAVGVTLNNPMGLSVDAAGNLYVSDTGNGIVRQLAFNNEFGSENLKNPSATQTLQFEINNPVTLTATAGTDFQISNGNNKCNTTLQPTQPPAVPTTCSVTLDFDPSYPGLRRSPITLTDTSTTPGTSYTFGLSGLGLGANALFSPGTINTLASSLNNPSAIAVDTAGDIFFAEAGAADIQVIPAGSSTPTVFVSGGQLQSPVALALDAAQNLYVADSITNAIYKINTSGNVQAIASPPYINGLTNPIALAADDQGNVFVALDGGASTGAVVEIYAGGQQVLIAGQGTVTAPNGIPATQAVLVQPSGLYLNPNGVLYVSDQAAFRVYDIDTSGIIHQFAGNGTQANTAAPPVTPGEIGFHGPAGLAGDAAGDIFIADAPGADIYVVFAGSSQNPDVAVLAGTGTPGSGGDGGLATLAGLNNPISVALDGPDNLYLVDAGNSSVREVTFQNPTLNFGNEKPGVTSAAMSTTLWDSGNQSLVPLSSFTPADAVDFALVSSGCPSGGDLLQGSTCSLSYTFTPATYGSYQTTATSTDNGVDNPQVITLIGNSPQPVFTVPPVTVNYGTPYTLSATLTSTGTAPTGTISFAITAPSGNAQTLCTNVPLAANGSASCSPSPTLLNVMLPNGYTFTAAYSGDSNYVAQTQSAALMIERAPVVITANSYTRAFNQPNPTLGGTITGVVNGQSITDTYTTTATQTSQPGVYPTVPGGPGVYTAGPGTLLGNYDINTVNGTLTITQAGGASVNSPAVSVTYGTPYSLVSTFSGTAPAPTPTGTATFSIAGQAPALCANVPLVGGVATCSPSPTYENVGAYSVTVTYSGDAYYPAGTSATSLTINQAPVTITANSTSRQYGTPNPSFSGTVTGVVVGQSINDTYTTTATQTSAPGNYPITPGGIGVYTAGPGTLLSNYSVTTVNGTLTITQNSTGLTFNTPAVNAIYGVAYALNASVTSSQTPGPTGTATFSLNGNLLCSNVPLVAGIASCAPSPTLENVGGYSVTVAYSGDANYLPATSAIPLTISPAPVTITAASVSRAYDTPNPAFTGTITPQYPFPSGQSLTATYATSATQTSAPGTYAIVPTAAAGPGTVLTNYKSIIVNGSLTVTATGTGISIAAPAVNAVYGTAYSLAATVTSAQTPAPAGTATFTIGGQSICAAATLAANGAATCAPSATLENVGTYTVTVAYSGDSYYAPTSTSLTLTITPAQVTITAASTSRVFDTPNPTFTGTITGVVSGQSITSAYSSPATLTSPAGQYPIVPIAEAGSGTLLTNYSITLVNGILTITPPAITTPTGSFTIAATPPEQEIDLSGTVQFPVTVTSVKGFTDSVSFSCSGLPAGASCSFAPASIAPAANASATSVMTITASSDNTNVPAWSIGARFNAPPQPGSPMAPIAWAWTMLPIGFSGSAAGILLGRKRRAKGKRPAHFTLWLVPLFLILAAITGCGAPHNYKIYNVTVTATDSAHATPVSQSTTVQLVLAR